MRMRNTLHELNNGNSYSEKNYGAWQKRHIKNKQTVFGIKKAIIKYINIENQRAFSLSFDYGRPLLYLYCPTLIRSNHEDFLSNLEESTKPLRWGSLSKGSIRNKSDDIISDITISTPVKTNNLEQLNIAVNIISEFASFPAEMVEDIKHEMKSALAAQEIKMNHLTQKLVEGNINKIKEIKDELDWDIVSYCAEYIKEWIMYLQNEGRLYEGILWCNTFPEKLDSYASVLVVAQELLMQIQCSIERNLEGNEAEIAFPLGENYHELSYKESLFKMAWKIAVKTNLESDKSFAVKLLNEISGQPNFTCGAELPKFTSADLLIYQANILKKISDENKALKERIHLLDAQQARTSQLGVFGKSVDNSGLALESTVTLHRRTGSLGGNQS